MYHNDDVSNTAKNNLLKNPLKRKLSYLTESIPISVFLDISKYPQAVIGVRDETFLRRSLILRLSSLIVSPSSLTSRFSVNLRTDSEDDWTEQTRLRRFKM